MRVNYLENPASRKCQGRIMLAVLIKMFVQGLVLAYPCSLLQALSNHKSPIKVDLHASSWLGSIIGAGNFPGFILSSVLMTFSARRLAYTLAILPGIIGWLIIYFAEDLKTLLIGRFLTGVTAGATASLEASIIGECISSKYRGAFLCLINVAVNAGVTSMHIISRCSHWRSVALLAFAQLVIAQLMFITCCDSLRRTSFKHQYKRTDTKMSREESEQAINAQKVTLPTTKLNLTYLNKFKAFFQKFKQKGPLNSVTILVISSLVVEMSGKHVFPAYALQLMAELTRETTQSFYFCLSMDILTTASVLVAIVLRKVVNQRIFLFSTGFSAVAVLLCISIHLCLTSKGFIPEDMRWIPEGLFGVYFILINLSYGAIPLGLVGEMFSLMHRETSSTLFQLWISICLTVSLKCSPHLLVNIGLDGFFAVYSSIMGLCLLILYFVLPETKNKIHQESECYFNYGQFGNTVAVDEEAKHNKIITKETSNII